MSSEEWDLCAHMRSNQGENKQNQKEGRHGGNLYVWLNVGGCEGMNA